MNVLDLLEPRDRGEPLSYPRQSERGTLNGVLHGMKARHGSYTVLYLSAVVRNGTTLTEEYIEGTAPSIDSTHARRQSFHDRASIE